MISTEKNDKQNISDLLTRMVAFGGGIYGYACFKKWEKDDDFYDNYSCSKVEERVLIKFLRKSIALPYLRYFIIDIFGYSLIDPESISDRVLDLCMRYPGKFRDTLLTQLGHMWLAPDQLERLNCKMKTPEAFYKLLSIYLTDAYPIIYLQKLLENNLHFIDELAWCQEWVLSTNATPDPAKIEIVHTAIARCKGL